MPRLKLKWAFAYANSRNGRATMIGCAYWRFDAPAVSRSSIVVGRLARAPSGYARYFTDYTRSAYALDADTGALLEDAGRHPAGGADDRLGHPVRVGTPAQGWVLDAAGPTIAGGTVYVNTGLSGRSGQPGTVLMAFSVDGR